MKIVIPSYKRAETLKIKTLAVLKKYKIPKELIYIFVGNEEEYLIYKEILPPYYNKIIIGEVGMRAIRNHIQSYFDVGEKLLCIDDDITQVVEKVDDKTLKQLDDLLKFANNGFDKCKELGTELWGINPCPNPFFMKNEYSQDLRYIIGSFWGVINNHDKETYVTLDDKEDFERTILYYKRAGKILRYNGISVKSAYYSEQGGMQETRTEERVEKSGRELLEKYPEFCSVNKARKKHFEIRLKDKTLSKTGFTPGDKQSKLF